MGKSTKETESGLTARRVRADLYGANQSEANRMVQERVAQREWEAQFHGLRRRIKAKIEGRHGASAELRGLEEAGVPRDRLYGLLAFTVMYRPRGLEFLRDQKEELLSVARRLKTLYPDVDEALRDPTMSRVFWRHTLGFGGSLNASLPQIRTWNDRVAGAFTLPVTMRVMADAFRKEATYFARLLRLYGRKDSPAHIARLLLEIFIFRLRKKVPDPSRPPETKPFRGKFQLDYLPEVARLLTCAFEANGKGKHFTAEGLGKIWKRHGLPMLVRWYSNTAPKAPPKRPSAALPLARLPILPPIQARPDTSEL